MLRVKIVVLLVAVRVDDCLKTVARGVDAAAGAAPTNAAHPDLSAARGQARVPALMRDVAPPAGAVARGSPSPPPGRERMRGVTERPGALFGGSRLPLRLRRGRAVAADFGVPRPLEAAAAGHLAGEDMVIS